MVTAPQCSVGISSPGKPTNRASVRLLCSRIFPRTGGVGNLQLSCNAVLAGTPIRTEPGQRKDAFTVSMAGKLKTRENQGKSTMVSSNIQENHSR